MLAKFRILFRRLLIRHRLPSISRAVRERLWKRTPEYDRYVNAQLERTLMKQTHRGVHTQILIDQVSKFTDLSHSNVLCVGSRNSTEIEYFYEKGARAVTGIDLYSAHPSIVVMDMHEMTFPADSFDLVFASHSLEHSYDVGKVVDELARVCRPGGLIVVEVPVNFRPSDVDRIDFVDLEHLHSAFAPHLREVLWSDSQAPETPENPHKISVIRTAFVIN